MTGSALSQKFEFSASDYILGTLFIVGAAGILIGGIIWQGTTVARNGAKTFESESMLWIVAVLLFGVADTVLTFLVISEGGREANPLARWALDLPLGLVALGAVKMVSLSIVYSVAHIGDSGLVRWVLLTAVLASGIFLTTNNAIAYTRALAS